MRDQSEKDAEALEALKAQKEAVAEADKTEAVCWNPDSGLLLDDIRKMMHDKQAPAGSAVDVIVAAVGTFRSLHHEVCIYI